MHELTSARFDSELDVLVPGEGREFLPVRNRDFAPLIGEDIEVLRWPRVVIQLGLVSPFAPGSPDMRTTVGTSSALASSTVFRMTASCACPETGCSWLPLAFSALSVRPRLEIFSRTRRGVRRRDQCVEVGVRRLRPVSRCDLDRVQAVFLRDVESCLER